jgi:hypothetical protein
MNNDDIVIYVRDWVTGSPHKIAISFTKKEIAILKVKRQPFF